MARRRATGRFYFLLILLLAVIAYLVTQHMPQQATEGIVSTSYSSDTRAVDFVIVRNEAVVSFDSIERIEFAAAEGEAVNQGDIVAEIYSTSYIRKELNSISAKRQSIRTYQKALFAENTDANLERLDQNVLLRARQLKRLVNGTARGNIFNLYNELVSAILSRQSWMTTNKLDDTRLTALFQDEKTLLSLISNWKNPSQAPMSGIISFYFDGYETTLTSDNFLDLTADTLRKVLSGVSSVRSDSSERSRQAYRIVSEDDWYIALLTRDQSWSPITGQELSFMANGFEDIIYTGTVIGVTHSGNDTVIQLRIKEPIGPLIYQRSGSGSVGIYTTGLSVPIGAITTQGTQTGVWVPGAYGVTFVPVDVLSQNKQYAIVQPMQSGTLYEGMTVMIYVK